jgi:glycogen synthase
MKLLIYSHFFAPSVGGVETIVLSLARGLAAIPSSGGGPEFEITLLTRTPAGSFDDRSLPFPVVRTPGFARLWRQIRASDVVHLAGAALGPLVLSLVSGRPVVVEHHAFQTICPNGQMFLEPAQVLCPGHFMAGRHAACLRCNSGLGWPASLKLWLLTFVRRLFCSRAAANIAPTAWLGGLLQLPRTRLVPHGLEITPAAPQLPAPRPAVPVIAFQGRLVSTKGTRILFEAARILCAQNRPFQLLIIGDGPERRALEQLAAEWLLSPHIRFAGRLDAAQLEACLAQASVVAVPSLAGEVFGLVVAENMIRGLPVVASDLGSFVEVLGEAGLTFPAGDGAALARQLALLLDDPDLARRLSGLARKRILDFFSTGGMIEQHARIYRTVAAAPEN